jgi:phage tail-like protein
MDANGTRYHLLLGYDDWANAFDPQASSPPLPPDLYWDPHRHELTLRPLLFQFPPGTTENPPSLADRRGAAQDRYGNWYWIDETRAAILVHSTGSGRTARFWPPAGDSGPELRLGAFAASEPPPPAPAPLLFSGLAITDDQYLVAGVLQPPGLLRFDLHAGGPPDQLFWPLGVPFVPFDMSPAPCGGVWILDRENACYWALDRHFHVLPRDQVEATLAPASPDDFQPLEGGSVRTREGRRFPLGVNLNAASPVVTRHAVAIEGLPDGTVLILESAPGESFSRIYRYHFGRMLGHPVTTASIRDLVEPALRPAFRLVGFDFAFVPEHPEEGSTVPDRLYVMADHGNQVFAFDLSQRNSQLELQPVPQYFPIRRFGGKALVAASGRAHYDFADRFLPVVAQQRPRYAVSATLTTRRFDGKEPDCVWHRLVMDACLPPETRVTIWSRTANQPQLLEHAAWQQEPPLYRRRDGSELPFAPRPASPDAGSWELLLQRARGRYLQLKLTLEGNARLTPRLRALRVYYPRFSYLEHYLPSVYREDKESAFFLDRFLANLEGFYTAIEDRIAAAQLLFDVRSAPAETLDWLAHWFGVTLDPSWEEARRRLFLRHALELFQFRGTIRGLQLALHLALDPCADESIFADSRRLGSIRIVEHYRTRRTPGIVFGDPTADTGIRAVIRAERWLPSLGRAELSARYQKALGLGPTALYPITAPGGQAAAPWRRFSETVLGFVPAATAADLAIWQGFLERRYGAIAAFHAAYSLAGVPQSAFSDVPLPASLPPDGAPLLDWFQFEAVVLAARRAAHRFSVLLPAPPARSFTAAEHQRRADLATRVVSLEKPAHTVFDVKFFWAMFRLGQARLELDTVIDRGSRAALLLPPLRLGQEYLAESYLAPSHPQDVVERTVIGRDRLQQIPTSWQEKTS